MSRGDALYQSYKNHPTVVRVVKKNRATSQYFIKSNLTHLTTDVMFSGQRFAIFAMFAMK